MTACGLQGAHELGKLRTLWYEYSPNPFVNLAVFNDVTLVIGIGVEFPPFSSILIPIPPPISIPIAVAILRIVVDLASDWLFRGAWFTLTASRFVMDPPGV